MSIMKKLIATKIDVYKLETDQKVSKVSKEIVATSFRDLPTDIMRHICSSLMPDDMAQILNTFKDTFSAGVRLTYAHFGLEPQEENIKDWINQNVISALSQMRKTRPDLYTRYVNRFGIGQQRIEHLIEQGNFGPLYKIVSNGGAFAAICSDGQIRCWGVVYGGGRLPDNLIPEGVNVNQIVSTSRAFAAICSDGQIRCWGYTNDTVVIPDNLIPDGVSVSRAEMINEASPHFYTNSTSTYCTKS